MGLLSDVNKNSTVKAKAWTLKAKAKAKAKAWTLKAKAKAKA